MKFLIVIVSIAFATLSRPAFAQEGLATHGKEYTLIIEVPKENLFIQRFMQVVHALPCLVDLETIAIDHTWQGSMFLKVSLTDCYESDLARLRTEILRCAAKIEAP